MCEVSQKSPMVYYMPHFGDILLDLLCAVFCPATKLIMSLDKKEETLEVFSLLSFNINKIVIFQGCLKKCLINVQIKYFIFFETSSDLYVS